MNDEDLLKLNAEGFIPGPSETESLFQKRVAKARKQQDEGTPLSEEDWRGARSLLEAAFHIKPTWLPAFYSNKSLPFWQGAASWIEGGRLVSIQLRKSLRKGSYFGYQKEEILAHEAVHAARCAFQEPRFEEFFAYETSSKKWRKIFGPIIQRPWEAWPLLIAMIAGMFHPLGYLIAAAWMSLGTWRLFLVHRCFRQASQHLAKWIQDPQKILFILFRLTDAEIQKFASGEDLIAYASKQHCLRWRCLRLAYLKNTLDLFRRQSPYNR